MKPKSQLKDKRLAVRHYLILKDVDPAMAEYISEGMDYDSTILAADWIKRNPIPAMEPAANERIETTVKGFNNA